MGLQTNCCCCEGTTHCIDASEAFVTGCAPGTSSGSVGSPLPRYLRVKLGSALACCGGNLNGTFTLKYVSGCLWQSGVIDCAGLLPGTGSPSFPTSIMLTIGFTSILTVNLNNGNTITYTKTAHWHSLCPNEMQITSPPTDCDGVLTKICVYPEIDPVCCVIDPLDCSTCKNGLYSTFEFDLTGTAGGHTHGHPTIIPVYILSQTEQVGMFGSCDTDPVFCEGAVYFYPNSRQFILTLTYDAMSDSWKGSATSFPGQPSGPTMRMEMFYGGADPDFPCVDSNFLWGHLWTDEMVANGFTEDTICVGRRGPGGTDPPNLYWYTLQEYECGTSGTASGQQYLTYSDWSPYLPYFIYKRPQQMAVDISGYTCDPCNSNQMLDDPNGTYILTRLTGDSHLPVTPGHAGNATAPGHCSNHEFDFSNDISCGGLSTTVFFQIGTPTGTAAHGDLNGTFNLTWDDMSQTWLGTGSFTRYVYNGCIGGVPQQTGSVTVSGTVTYRCNSLTISLGGSGSDAALCDGTFAITGNLFGVCGATPGSGILGSSHNCAEFCGGFVGATSPCPAGPDSFDPGNSSNNSCNLSGVSPTIFICAHVPNCPSMVAAVFWSPYSKGSEISSPQPGIPSNFYKFVKVVFQFTGSKQDLWDIQDNQFDPWGTNTLTLDDSGTSAEPKSCSAIPNTISLNFVSFLPEPVTP